jgi:deoxyribodipyrimidine photolyase
MSVRPIESVFGVPEPPSQISSDAHISDIATHKNVEVSEGVQSGLTRAEGARPEETRVSEPPAEWANDELQSIANTIEELQNRLALANQQLGSVAKVEATEVEIGRLFVEAQRFSESTLANLEYQIHEILHQVEAKAAQILTEATSEAQEIRRQADQAAAASAKTERELHAAIAGFSAIANELAREFGDLNAVLPPGDEQRSSETALSSSGSESD